MPETTLPVRVDKMSARHLGRYAAMALLLVAAGLLVLRGLAAELPPALTGALRASLIIALATAGGALPALVIRHWTTALHDSLMGFSAGIMLGAVIFTLTLPAIREAQQLWPPLFGMAAIALAIMAGAILVWGADRLVPHEHLSWGRAGADSQRVRGVWLVVMTMALHHVPEGFAVGASYGQSSELGLLTAIGIGVQSIPEGLVVAAGLCSIGYARHIALGVAVLTGLSQPLGAVLGVLLSGLGATALPLMLAAAGGAMLFVISHEIIPESHRAGNESQATFALMTGFIAMLVLVTIME